MHKNILIPSILSASLFGLSSAAVADSQHEFSQHQAHVHGMVTFNMVQDGNDFLIEVESPGQDILGFEHAPSSQAEKQAYQQAVDLLKQPNQLFTLAAAANCQPVDFLVKDNIGQDEHHHDEHDHDSHQANGHDDHHDHDHDQKHGTFTIQYQYQCKNISQLSKIETQWFSHFPASQTIEVNLLTDSAQKHIELKQPQQTIAW
ncbi:MAG TPA: DUF2796 domain-containing protein [Vibrio sp.]|uniref:zinc uptake protein ZrgA n=1 Tax=Vibrio sp. TaxID=678 RepID=UPI000EC09002|nr:DUF2796 domain-containing protein [Vibrio sp.]HCH01342.1 DUF2796 domain-containing protein [Vibrio sp.]